MLILIQKEIGSIDMTVEIKINPSINFSAKGLRGILPQLCVRPRRASTSNMPTIGAE
jgi:hypothetical protein